MKTNEFRTSVIHGMGSWALQKITWPKKVGMQATYVRGANKENVEEDKNKSDTDVLFILLIIFLV